MNFYVRGIVSIVASFGMKLQNELRLYKDVLIKDIKLII